MLLSSSVYLFKVKTWITRKLCETCSKLAIETPKRSQWHHSCVFVAEFEKISHIVQVFSLLALSKYVLTGLTLPKSFHILDKRHIKKKSYCNWLWSFQSSLYIAYLPLNIYLFKINNRNTTKRFKICSKLTAKTQMTSLWCFYC